MTTAIVVSDAQEVSLDYLITSWLHAKALRSESVRTTEAYSSTLAQFRAFLARYALDLDSPSEQAIADAAQAWAAQRWDTDAWGRASGPVSANTFNQRLAIVSSFYAFAKKRRRLTVNPIEMVDRRPVERYSDTRPLDAQSLIRKLEAIDRATLAGLRDYAILSVLLGTGRRRFEIAGMRVEQVAVDDVELPQITLTYRRTKGNKAMRDQLRAGQARPLLAYLHAIYPEGLAEIAPDAPLWLALAPRLHGRRVALTAQGIRDICVKRLGVSKVHATRHTFAATMEALGAPLSLIRDRLGHSDAGTTSRYLTSMHKDENPYGERLAALLGIG